MKQAIVMAAAISLAAAPTVFANEAAAVKADPAKAQQIVSTVCVGCHGADGNSPAPVNPKLSGQHAAYLTKQLQNFKVGERKNPIMMGMVAALSPDDMRNLGAYYSTQKSAAVAVKDKALAAQGEKLYRGGNPATGVPACAACHGATGVGIPAQYPRLAGQHGEYVETQLKTFRNSERANDPSRMMQAVAVKMTDQEIKAVAEYVSSLN